MVYFETQLPFVYTKKKTPMPRNETQQTNQKISQK